MKFNNCCNALVLVILSMFNLQHLDLAIVVLRIALRFSDLLSVFFLSFLFKYSLANLPRLMQIHHYRGKARVNLRQRTQVSQLEGFTCGKGK